MIRRGSWPIRPCARRASRRAEILAAIPAQRTALVPFHHQGQHRGAGTPHRASPLHWRSARRHLRGDFLAADLAAAHGASGPVQCVSLACVSGLVAVTQGAKLIQRGAADAVLVVGVDHLSAFVMAGFSALKALDPDGCRPFDRERRGLSPGEAGAAIVLVSADKMARSGILIRGWVREQRRQIT